MHDTPNAQPPESGYIRRLDPDWITMVKDVSSLDDKCDQLGEKLDQLVQSNHRQERYMVGGWDETGTIWVTGIRERVGALEKTNKVYFATIMGAWTIVEAILVIFIRNSLHL